MNGVDIDGQGSADARQKAKRRSKNNGDDRNFTCGCGKSYLSYPALYTHIKTKHEGVPPAGTSQHQANGKSGRGRPKKEDSSAKHKEDEPEEESVDLSDSIDIKYLSDLSDKIQYEGQTTDEVQKSLVCKESEVDVINDFPVDVFRGREDEYLPVLECLKSLQAGNTGDDESVNPMTELKQASVNKILASYIYEVAPSLRTRFYKEFVFFLLMYRRALNEAGWDARLKMTGKGPEEETKEFCEASNGEYIPEISNDFIADLLPEYLKDYDLKGFKVIGPEVPGLRNSVFLTQHLCNWLNYQKYTSARLVLNPDDT